MIFFLNKQKTVGYGARIADLIYKRFDERNYIQEVNQHDSNFLYGVVFRIIFANFQKLVRLTVFLSCALPIFF